MLSSLASYLLGGANAKDVAASDPSTPEELKETEVKGHDGDEWILIDSDNAAQAAVSDDLSEEDMSFGSASDGETSDETPTKRPSHLVPKERPEPSVQKPKLKIVNKSKKLAKPALASRKAHTNSTLSQPLAKKAQAPVELPVVEVPSPTLPGPRSYAATAALARAEEEAAADASHAKVATPPPQPAKLPKIVVKPLTLPTKKKSNKMASTGTMEGSWFVTPPPCFTRPNTFMMESSPLEDILIEHPSISVYSPRPAPLSDDNSHMSVGSSANSSGCSTPVAIPSSPPAAESPAPLPPKVAVVPVVPSTQAAGSPLSSLPTELLLPFRARKFRRPQLQREPMQEMTNNCLVRLVPKRSERKTRKQSRKEAKESEKKSQVDLRKSQPTAQEAAAHAALLAEVRARAFEPVAQERIKQLRSQKYLKKSFMERANSTALQLNRHPNRRGKMAILPNSGVSPNRKTNRSC